MRSTLLVCLLFTAIAASLASNEDVCGRGYSPIALRRGSIANTKGFASKAAAQLSAAIAKEVHRNEDCKVLKRTTVEQACSRAVKKGDTLDRDDTKAAASGTLYDMIIVATIKCPDGGFKVRYEARGIKSTSSKLKGIQTRFIDVFDSTYA